ncbi:MAG TPA: LytTR family DNA-binding domain-containing protein [Longimicrobium sp.]|jgi:two-component system LytT family response regulator
MTTIRTLIVDDEPLARERLRTLLEREDDVEVVGECGDGVEAVDSIVRLEPDLVFLDVQMPGVDGFEVIRRVGAARMPFVVFATAFDDFALQAFEANALDYLLKPFERERFRVSLERARRQLGQRGGARVDPRFLEWLEGLSQAAAEYRERFVVKTGNRFRVVRAADVDWIEAADNYVRLHLGKEQHLLRETMSELDRSLDPRRFVRIHRSTIVNVDRIHSIESWGAGEFLFVLADGTKLASSRGYRDRLRSVLGW